MKKSEIIPLLAAATLFRAPAVLTAQPAPVDDEAPPHPRGPRWERFDANQDGKLDEAERAELENTMRTHLTQNPRFLARADTDGDGAISDAEWSVAKEKMQNLRQRRQQGARDGRQGPARAREAREPEFQRGYLLGKFDANGDHKLDQAERETMKADIEQRVRTRMEKQLARLKAADTDGDGKFSDDEWAAAKQTFRKEFQQKHPGMRRPGMPPSPPTE